MLKKKRMFMIYTFVALFLLVISPLRTQIYLSKGAPSNFVQSQEINIYINVTDATAFDSILIVVNFTNDLSGVNPEDISCSIADPVGVNKIFIQLSYNESSGNAEGNFFVNQYWRSGQYTVSSVQYTIRDLETRYYHSINGIGFVSPTVNIWGTLEDISPPELLSVEFNKDVVSTSENFKIICGVSDDLSGIDEVSCIIYNQDSGDETPVNLTLNRSSNLYEVSLKIITCCNNFTIENVILTDFAGNKIVLHDGTDYNSPIINVQEGSADSGTFSIPGFISHFFLLSTLFSIMIIIKKTLKKS